MIAIIEIEVEIEDEIEGELFKNELFNLINSGEGNLNYPVLNKCMRKPTIVNT